MFFLRARKQLGIAIFDNNIVVTKSFMTKKEIEIDEILDYRHNGQFEILQEKLLQVKHALNYHSEPIVVGYPYQKILHHTLSIESKLSEKEQQKYLKKYITTQLNIKSDPLYFDFHHNSLFVADKNYLEMLTALFSKLKLRLRCIDIDICALARLPCFLKHSSDTKKTIIVAKKDDNFYMLTVEKPKIITNIENAPPQHFQAKLDDALGKNNYDSSLRSPITIYSLEKQLAEEHKTLTFPIPCNQNLKKYLTNSSRYISFCLSNWGWLSGH